MSKTQGQIFMNIYLTLPFRTETAEYFIKIEKHVKEEIFCIIKKVNMLLHKSKKCANEETTLFSIFCAPVLQRPSNLDIMSGL